jgi:hypothetical protein
MNAEDRIAAETDTRFMTAPRVTGIENRYRPH